MDSYERDEDCKVRGWERLEPQELAHGREGEDQGGRHHCERGRWRTPTRVVDPAAGPVPCVVKVRASSTARLPGRSAASGRREDRRGRGAGPGCPRERGRRREADRRGGRTTGRGGGSRGASGREGRWGPPFPASRRSGDRRLAALPSRGEGARLRGRRESLRARGAPAPDR